MQRNPHEKLGERYTKMSHGIPSWALLRSKTFGRGDFLQAFVGGNVTSGFGFS